MFLKENLNKSFCSLNIYGLLKQLSWTNKQVRLIQEKLFWTLKIECQNVSKKSKKMASKFEFEVKKSTNLSTLVEICAFSISRLISSSHVNNL